MTVKIAPTTAIEFEAKALDIDVDAMVERIRSAGGRHVTDRTMRRYVYDVKPATPDKWIRLRDTGSEVTLCVKEITSDAIDGTQETEVVVDDFETTHALLATLGFQAKAYQENRRSSYLLGDVRLEIDSWPLIPTYLEIEGDSTDQVLATTARLGIDPATLTSENTTAVYARYGIDLTAITDLRF